MIEKEYYRVDELQSRFGMSFRDIRDFVESTKNPLAFYIKQNKFIIGGWKANKGLAGFGVASYRGLVNIPANEQLKIIGNEKLTVKTFSLLNKEMISAHDIEYPFESTLPNSFLYSWEPRPLSEISWESIPAKLFPKEQEDSRRAFGKGLKDIFSAITGEEMVVDEKLSKTIGKIPQKEFYSAGIELSISDICVLHTDLVRLGVCDPSLSSSLQKVKQLEVNRPSDDFPSINRPIDILLVSMLKMFPQDKPADTWSRLKNDAGKDPRQFDIDEILDEVGEKELYWFDIEGEQQSLKKKSFYNLIGKLKKS